MSRPSKDEIPEELREEPKGRLQEVLKARIEQACKRNLLRHREYQRLQESIRVLQEKGCEIDITFSRRGKAEE